MAYLQTITHQTRQLLHQYDGATDHTTDRTNRIDTPAFGRVRDYRSLNSLLINLLNSMDTDDPNLQLSHLLTMRRRRLMFLPRTLNKLGSAEHSSIFDGRHHVLPTNRGPQYQTTSGLQHMH